MADCSQKASLNLKLVRTPPAIRWESGNVGRLKEHFLEVWQFSGKGRGNWKPTKCFTVAKRPSVPELVKVWSQGSPGKVVMYRPGQGTSGAVVLIYQFSVLLGTPEIFSLVH